MPNEGEKPSRSSSRVAGKAPWVLMAGSGLELALITIAFGGIGALIDHQTGMARPIVSAFGGLIGFVLGMIRFIRMATRVSQAQRKLESSDANSAASRGEQTASEDPES